MKGRYQVRQHRRSHKARRYTRKLDSLSVVQDRVRIESRQPRDNRVVIREWRGPIADSVRANIGVQPGAPVRLANFETETYAPRSFLVVRLKPDSQGRFVEHRNRLLDMAELFHFGATAVYGPKASEDEETGLVYIRLYQWVPSDPLAAELTAAGWRQSQADQRIFTIRRHYQTRQYAVKFCERHAGEWYSLSKVPQEAVDVLHRSDWCELSQRVRPLPSSGTAAHALEWHRWHKPPAGKTRKLLSIDAQTAGPPGSAYYSRESSKGFRGGIASRHGDYVIHPYGNARATAGNRLS